MKTSIFCLLAIIVILNSCTKSTIKNNTTVNAIDYDIRVNKNSITLSEAAKVAYIFLQSKNPYDSIKIINSNTLVKNNKPYFHIINANKGFVIISPDSSYVPILAYDSINNFSFKENYLNEGLKIWFNKHAHELDFVRNNQSIYIDSISKKNKTLWKIIGDKNFFMKSQFRATKNSNNNVGITKDFVRGLPGDPPVLLSSVPAYSYNISVIGPLCWTQWYQNSPYNAYCPPRYDNYSGDGHALTGCLPTAIAQVMAFNRFPTNYDWSSMAPFDDKSNPLNNSMIHPERFESTALLMNAIGHTPTSPLGTIFVDYYNQDGTAGHLDQAPIVFSNFGYTNSGTLAGYNFQSTPIFSGPGNNLNTDLIINEITSNQRPCILDGWTDETKNLFGAFYVASGKGHSWVCDGTNLTKYYYGNTNTYQRYDGSIYSQTTYTNIITASAFLHMNWGLCPLFQGGPNDDGWYDYNTDYTKNWEGKNFKYFQQVLYNIYP
jgi:hypothetical protein